MVLYRLTKSKFIRGQQCHKALYLDVYHPELGYYPSEVLERFARGRSFEAKVKAQFEGGIDVLRACRGINEAPATTAELLKNNNETTLYEAAFVYDEVLVLADIVHKTASGEVTVYEVKNSKAVTDVFRNDVSVQHYVIANALQELPTLSLKDFSLICNDGSDNPLTLSLLDVARDAMKHIAAQVQQFKEVLQGTEPQVAMGVQCESPYACPYQRYCSRKPRGQRELDFNSL
ncbi:MAG: hypothetical protein K5864_09365 [Bacteroidales bacterium]|nr:hypothetical protein [Bacteroidales bacterium]